MLHIIFNPEGNSNKLSKIQALTGLADFRLDVSSVEQEVLRDGRIFISYTLLSLISDLEPFLSF
jgi:hypothetical protein